MGKCSTVSVHVSVSEGADLCDCVCRVLCALVHVCTGAHTPRCLLGTRAHLTIGGAWEHKAVAISHLSGCSGRNPHVV